MSTELMQQDHAATSRALSVEGLLETKHVVHDAMARAMKKDEHYGVIPGTNGKATLLKPGAELLCMLFGFAPTFEITRRDLPGDHVEYEIICNLIHANSGTVRGSGVGLCSSMEAKYRWRQGSIACPDCGSSSIIKGKEEYGGGWLCWKKKGGCGAKFPDSQFDKSQIEKVENPDIADTYNTVLKMAKKRALVDATLTATAASDVFTQDVEDFPDAKPAEAEKPETITVRPDVDHVFQLRDYLHKVCHCNNAEDANAVIYFVSQHQLRGIDEATKSDKQAFDVLEVLYQCDANKVLQAAHDEVDADSMLS